jgi:hypothetical protein
MLASHWFHISGENKKKIDFITSLYSEIIPRIFILCESVKESVWVYDNMYGKVDCCILDESNADIVRNKYNAYIVSNTKYICSDLCEIIIYFTPNFSTYPCVLDKYNLNYCERKRKPVILSLIIDNEIEKIYQLEKLIGFPVKKLNDNLFDLYI